MILGILAYLIYRWSWRTAKTTPSLVGKIICYPIALGSAIYLLVALANVGLVVLTLGLGALNSVLLGVPLSIPQRQPTLIDNVSIATDALTVRTAVPATNIPERVVIIVVTATASAFPTTYRLKTLTDSPNPKYIWQEPGTGTPPSAVRPTTKPAPKPTKTPVPSINFFYPAGYSTPSPICNGYRPKSDLRMIPMHPEKPYIKAIKRNNGIKVYFTAGEAEYYEDGEVGTVTYYWCPAEAEQNGYMPQARGKG